MPLPHPEHEIARRIAALGSLPGVTVRSPLTSPSGLWEAEAPGWLVREEDPSRFCAELEARLGRP